MDDYRYIYAVARVSVLSTKLIDLAFASRLLAAEPNDAFRMLNETVYAEDLADVQSPAELDRALIAELGKVYDLLMVIAPEKELIELFRRRYDFYNLKVLLKAQATGIAPGAALIDLGTYDLARLSAAVNESAYRFVPEYIRKTALQALAEHEKTKKLSAIGYTCDRLMWIHLFDIASRNGNRIICDLLREQIDLMNIKMFLRVKEFAEDRSLLEKYFVPGGSIPLSFLLRYMDEQMALFLSHLDKTDGKREVLSEGLNMWPEDKSFWRLEVALDNFILRRFHEMRMKLFSIAPLIYYLLRKEAEAKLIRTIIRGKLVGLPRIEIEERIRFLYA